ncbi:hypothetical protein L1987_24282 [Smallanthus sonchifolius]|uniref:Uncharacterized protein n=1 Tax=Smallanthus sonchifolius TaxID=185202 RepID=A0ACB9IKX0_9ASTR|nr:hypothetical protein L1987_24282 [Smallanthus sonchifolius]
MHGQTQIPQQVNSQPEEQQQQQQVNSQQQPNSFPESFLIQHEQLQTRPQSSVPSHSFQKTEFTVYKSGSVGRSLDITRFNSYPELREELGQMFNIEGLLEDPQRSGWQLVFVDRENDVLLLGDGPWEAFVNSVWYIKILSPEDVQKLGKQELESFSQNSGERIGNDDYCSGSLGLKAVVPELGTEAVLGRKLTEYIRPCFL